MREWDEEPDEKKFEIHGMKCAIVRHPIMLHLCGYVGVDCNSPLWGVPYSIMPVEVHGGLTFSGEGYNTILHKDYYWFGFDCAHAGDLIPQYENLPFEAPPSKYRNMKYVRSELCDLAYNIARIEEFVRKLPIDSLIRLVKV